MAYTVDTLIDVTPERKETSYFIYSKHRGNPTDEVSVWTVTLENEVLCFTHTYFNTWHIENSGWGIIVNNGYLLPLGRNLRNPELFIAKFVYNGTYWHGYPADLRYKANDKPSPPILQNWYEQRIISKATLTRIKQGQL